MFFYNKDKNANDLNDNGLKESHKHMTSLSEQECKDEIMKVHNRVKELTGVEMDLFRPPYGDYNNMVVGVARDCGYYTIQWDVDSLNIKVKHTQSAQADIFLYRPVLNTT